VPAATEVLAGVMVIETSAAGPTVSIGVEAVGTPVAEAEMITGP
jgi:hypothetical protein